VITIWNVVLGISVMLWAFGYAQTRNLLSKSGRADGDVRTLSNRLS
jgi:hypothetical protein